MNTTPSLPQTASQQSVDTTQFVYQNWRANFARPMLIGALIFGLVALIPALLSAQSYILSVIFISAYLILVAITVIQFPYWLRMGAFLFIVYALGLSELSSTGILGDALFFFLGFIVLATMMFSPRAGMTATAISLATFVVIGSLSLSRYMTFLSTDAMPAQITDWFSAGATTLLFSVTIILGLRQLQFEFLEAQKGTAQAVQKLETARGSLEERVEERTLQLKAVNEVARVATAILDPQELVSRVVHLISDQFGYYYAAIFLVDEKGEWATLQDATGEAGRVLKENKHRLRVGGNSMVGAAVSTSQPRIAQDVGAEPVRFENPLLPYTRSEIALPLAVGDRVLGALDVQSTKQAAFGPQEIETLQSMARQVAIAFENARLFQEAQKRLEEMQMIQRQYVLESWKPLAGSESLEYKIGDEEARAGAAELEIPLALRDEIIGQLSLTSEADWTPEQRNLIEAVATQAALALENARLVEESQSSAARERLLAEITGKVWSSTTIDGILQTAVRELGRALDASEASIELKMDERHG